VFATVIPSKLFESMGMGLPVIMALPEGEATAIVRQTGIGVVVPPENPARLAEAVLELHAHPEQMEVLRQASRVTAPSFTRTRQAEKMLAVLRAVAEGRAVQAVENEAW
jgi:glycosyltransferase involved in cell wall biosynthesis